MFFWLTILSGFLAGMPEQAHASFVRHAGSAGQTIVLELGEEVVITGQHEIVLLRIEWQKSTDVVWSFSSPGRTAPTLLPAPVQIDKYDTPLFFGLRTQSLRRPPVRGPPVIS